MKCLLLYCCAFLIILSCTHSKSPVKDFVQLVTDTSISHLPFNEINSSKDLSLKMNLPLIFNGVDSFELRIWMTSMVSPSSASVVRFAEGEWYVFNYLYYIGHEGVDSCVMKRMPYPNGMEEMIPILTSDSVLNLPSQAAVPGFIDNVADGHTIFIEITTSRYYKAWQYHCPERFPLDIHHQRFLRLVRLLNEYFHFYFPVC